MTPRRKVIGAFARLSLSVLLTGFALFLMVQVFGWFAAQKSIDASNQNLQTKGIENIEIRASADGENIGVTVAEKNMEKLPMDGTLSTLRPGISGSFSFYVHCDSSGGETGAYNFRYGVSVENNQFHEGADFPEGYYPNTDENTRAQAKDYINAHLLFFTHMENGVYSGWISPGYSIRCAADPAAGSSPYKATVYWVWVSWYQEIFEENNGLIEEETRKEIAAYYSEEGNIDKMFSDGTKAAEAYNMADTLIGVTLKYICFQINVCKE